MTTEGTDSPRRPCAAADFATALDALRTRSGLSYRQLGRQVFVSASTVHRYCKAGAVPVDEELVDRLAEACRAEPSEREQLVARWRAAAADRAFADPGPGPDGRVAEPEAHEQRGGRRRTTWVAALAGLVILLVVAGGSAIAGMVVSHRSATTGSAGGCVAAAGVYRADGTTGAFHHVWTHDVTCTTKSDITVHAEHSAYSPAVGTMRSTQTWFVCWALGTRPPAGRSRLWFYTQGDEARPAAARRHAWGFVSADDARTASDQPPSDLEKCPSPAKAARRG